MGWTRLTAQWDMARRCSLEAEIGIMGAELVLVRRAAWAWQDAEWPAATPWPLRSGCSGLQAASCGRITLWNSDAPALALELEPNLCDLAAICACPRCRGTGMHSMLRRRHTQRHCGTQWFKTSPAPLFPGPPAKLHPEAPGYRRTDGTGGCALIRRRSGAPWSTGWDPAALASLCTPSPQQTTAPAAPGHAPAHPRRRPVPHVSSGTDRTAERVAMQGNLTRDRQGAHGAPQRRDRRQAG